MDQQNRLIKIKKVKTSIIIVSCLLLCFLSCSKKRQYVRPEDKHSKKLVVLPEKYKGKSYEPYVINGERYYPLPDSLGFEQKGKASWYGRKFHGRPTASGELYDMYKKSAAHKTLPLGTYVMVRNLDNNKKITVRINDRGPFVKGRIIDLSFAAAKEIDLVGPGVADVRIKALGREVGVKRSLGKVNTIVETEDLKRGEFTVQVGAFRELKNAVKLAAQLRASFDYVNISNFIGARGIKLYRVWVSKSKTINGAEEIEKKLEAMGFEGAFTLSL